ncbi:hypothetical protein JAAARDRAFT_38371 [Jaapia argillacea MUCL 33604]|uniref:Uncharacterized protein n=1 Tax=Jaapia argillacea MUCL 33604 TaxID=933084 RepID=A0A067PIF6_9AGAM|nr:hypothetical protein JAAARDRAFT_38371 [Jaapia argillacea MUCL 33604]
MLPVAYHGATGAHMSRYVVKSSDVISEGLRVNVYREGSDRVVWYKERFLTDDEIVEQVLDNATTSVCWSIHRPKRGWYIHIRSPAFPPHVHIALQPLPKGSPFFAEAAMSFACRTNIPRARPPSFPFVPSSPSSSSTSSVDTDITLTEGSNNAMTTTVHSYPPTPPPPTVVVQPPSPKSIHAKLDDISPSQQRPRKSHPKRKPQPPSTQVSHFLLTPHNPEPAQQSLLSRALSALRSSQSSQGWSSSFSLCPVPADQLIRPPNSGPPAPSTSSPVSSYSNPPSIPLLPPTAPLLTYLDQTPTFTLNSSTALLSLNESQALVLGVQPSFWIAVALTYAEFLADRDSYLAAMSD